MILGNRKTLIDEEPVEGRHKICGNPQVMEPSASRADRFLLPSLLHAERPSMRGRCRGLRLPAGGCSCRPGDATVADRGCGRS